MICTKDVPWDGMTLPVEHVDACFIDDTELIECPNCKYCWSMRDL